MSNQNNVLAIQSDISAEAVSILKQMGFCFQKDANGNLKIIKSNIINPEKMMLDPDMLRRFKGGFFYSAPPENSNWIYISISNGKIKNIIPITTIKIETIIFFNYNNNVFDFMYVTYSAGSDKDINSTSADKEKKFQKIIRQNNYSPKRIINDFKGLPYLSEDGERLKGPLVYYLVSQYISQNRITNYLIGEKQGWNQTPDGKYIFNPQLNFKKEIMQYLPPSVQCRENPVNPKSKSSDYTKELAEILRNNIPFSIAVLLRIASFYSCFFKISGVVNNQITVVHPNDHISVNTLGFLFRNTGYECFESVPLGPNIKPLKNAIETVNDGIVLVTDPFSADQYKKIEKGLDCCINDVNGASGTDSKVNHTIVIISRYADLNIPKEMCCVLNFDGVRTYYDIADRCRRVLKQLDAAVIKKVIDDFKTFSDCFFDTLLWEKANKLKLSFSPKADICTILLTTMKVYNKLFTPLFPDSLEQDIINWLSEQEQDIQDCDDVVCSEYGRILNERLRNGYFNLAIKDEVTHFSRGNHTIIVDKRNRRIYIEPDENFEIVKEMKSINDTDRLTTALFNEEFLHVNDKNSKCHRLTIIDDYGDIHKLYSHAINFSLLAPDNRQYIELADKAPFLLKKDETMPLGFIPLIETIDGRIAGKFYSYNKEENNHYFGTGRTGSGKTWEIAQLLPVLSMTNQLVVVFDVSNSFTKEKLEKMLPHDVIEKMFHFINVGVESDMIPVNISELRYYKGLPNKKKAVFSILRAATGAIDKETENKLKKYISKYLSYVGNLFFLDDLCTFCTIQDPSLSKVIDTIRSVIDDMKAIDCEERTWNELFAENEGVIVINLGKEVGSNNHQLLDMMIASLFSWQMNYDKFSLNIAIDELKDQDLTKGSPINTIMNQGRKFHTNIIGATQNYINPNNDQLDIMKQAGTQSIGKPSKAEDRIAKMFGFKDAVDAGFEKFSYEDRIIEADFFNKESCQNETCVIRGKVINFVDTPFYQLFKDDMK